MRALGPEAAEVPVLAVAPQLRGNGLARALLAQLEAALLGAGVRMLLMPGVPYYGSQLQYAHTPQVRRMLACVSLPCHGGWESSCFAPSLHAVVRACLPLPLPCHGCWVSPLCSFLAWLL